MTPFGTRNPWPEFPSVSVWHFKIVLPLGRVGPARLLDGGVHRAVVELGVRVHVALRNILLGRVAALLGRP